MPFTCFYFIFSHTVLLGTCTWCSGWYTAHDAALTRRRCSPWSANYLPREQALDAGQNVWRIHASVQDAATALAAELGLRHMAARRAKTLDRLTCSIHQRSGASRAWLLDRSLVICMTASAFRAALVGYYTRMACQAATLHAAQHGAAAARLLDRVAAGAALAVEWSVEAS